jgi:hypothetical protein
LRASSKNSCHLLGIGHVCGHKACVATKLCCNGHPVGGWKVSDDNFSTKLDQTLCRRTAEAGCASGYNCGITLNIHYCRSLDLKTFDDRCVCKAAGLAHCLKPIATAALFKRVQHGGHEAPAGGTKRVSASRSVG